MATSSWDGPALGSNAFQQLKVGADCGLFADFAVATLTIDWANGVLASHITHFRITYTDSF
ncbi:hypothetical protein PG993_009323 [Apiospora rasikravindrae]|uniref:Uncharacterized protein n=1 Tax=Apiospora rasikravindrae TaxID=990691 RepID=A0ABR1SJ28_9PEZI